MNLECFIIAVLEDKNFILKSPGEVYSFSANSEFKIEASEGGSLKMNCSSNPECGKVTTVVEFCELL